MLWPVPGSVPVLGPVPVVPPVLALMLMLLLPQPGCCQGLLGRPPRHDA